MKNMQLMDALFFISVALGFALGLYMTFLPVWALTKYVMGW